jgi:hypothetical protein
LCLSKQANGIYLLKNAPSHIFGEVRAWIDQAGFIVWFLWSPDLTVAAIFLWVYTFLTLLLAIRITQIL